MQTSSNAGQENSTIPLITIYLIGLLTWTLFIGATNIFSILSNRVNNDRADPDDEADHLEENSPSIDNLFLDIDLAENEPEYLLLDAPDLKNNCDDSEAVGKDLSNFENEIITEEPLKQSDIDTEPKMSLHAVHDKGSNNAIALVEKGSNLRKVHFTLSMDQYREQFGNDVALSKLISKDFKLENCPKNVCDRENGGTSSNSEKRLTNERTGKVPNATEDSTATQKKPIPEERTLQKPTSKEHFHERTIPMSSNVSKAGNSVRDERNSDIFVELEQLLNRTTNDTMESSQNKNYIPEELLGVVPEKEPIFSTAEESATRSSSDPAQSQIEQGAEEEKKERDAVLAEAKPLENSHGGESTILLSRAQSTGYGKEEEGLNAMIRRMILSELKRHRKKKQMVLKRAYSDTESVMPSTKHDAKTRTGLFNLKGRTFFRNLIELEESMRKRADSGSDTDGTVYGPDRKPSNLAESARQDEAATIEALATLNRPRGSSLGTMCNFESNIMLERKVSVHCLPETPESIETINVPTEQNQMPATKSTQTEHVYVIHAIRSCPLRKGRPLVQLQLHRLATGREPASSKVVFANLDYTRFVFRKASDNLIYERGKASGSPSYIPNPERFRWKYVMPSKAK